MAPEELVDDIEADALAAYREVAGRTEAPAQREAAAEPVTKDVEAPVETKVVEKPSADGRAREPDGKFAKKSDAPDAEKAPAEKASADPVKKDAGDGVQAPAATAPAAGGPPPSFSVKTKADWEKIPEHVRADILKREGEVAQGLSALRDFKDIKPYAEMAAKHGTTIKAALDKYVGMENTLKRDVGQGLAVILQNYGYTKEQAVKLFTDLATKYGGGPAAPGAQQSDKPTGDPLIDAMRPVLAPIMDKINGIENRFTTQDRTAQAAAERQRVDAMATELTKFAADPANRFFAELEDQMSLLIEKGVVPLTGNHAADLRAAYDTAARMHPEVSEALIEQRLAEQAAARRKKEQEEADKARFSSRSITGSRIPGTQTIERQEDNSHDDIEADVRRAYRAVSARA